MLGNEENTLGQTSELFSFIGTLCKKALLLSGLTRGDGRVLVLGQLPRLELPTVCMTVGQGPTALVVCAGGGCLDIFTLLSFSLGDGPI